MKTSRLCALVGVHSDSCPPDLEQTAELYLLGHLAPADASAFEDHYMTCAACAQVVEETNEFVQALRTVLREGGLSAPDVRWKSRGGGASGG